ncbi:hypothetical protein HMI55_001375 [Coelomomyces lativittatus]|nr:hypothetical protein HMI55_001375 [Coelomomyces lativittatus]
MGFFLSSFMEYPFTFFSVFIFIGVPLSFFWSIRKRYRKDLPCGKNYSWFLGHLPYILQNKERLVEAFSEYQTEIYKDCGSLNTITYFPFDNSFISTSDPRNLEYLLKTNFHNYVKGEDFHQKQKILLGQGIFNVDGDAWKKQRKSASLLFSVKNFREFMMEVFIQHSRTLCKKLDECVANTTVIDLYDLLLRFTLDAFLEIGMGCHLDSLNDEKQHPFASAFDRAQTIIFERFTRPKFFWIINEWLSGTRQELKRCMKIVNSFAENIIKERRMDTNYNKKSDLLSKFLMPSNFNDESTTYTDLELRDIVINFIIAGRDTTAQALSWCFFLLCQHPMVMKKLREEINNLCKENQKELDYDAVKSLSYAQAVFKETLRLYPSVPKEIKYAVKDDVWPDGTRIPAGQAIIWSPYGMGRSEHLWGSDALEFRPERWEKEFQPSPFKYPVFNAGPRACPGQQMAMLEGVFCLAKLVQKYDFHLVDPNEVTYNEALTLQMKNGLRVYVKNPQ